MSPRILNPVRSSLSDVNREHRFTLFRLRRSKPAASLVPGWESLHKESQSLVDKEQALAEKLEEALAWVEYADAEALDPAVRGVIGTLLKIVDNDREHVRYQHFMKGVAPSHLLRPVLGAELVAVRPWLESLKAAPEKELVDLAPGLKAAVEEGDRAAAALIEARRQLDEFRTNACVIWFDKINAERRALYGELGKLEADPRQHLEEGYADRFFFRRSQPAASAESLAALQQEEAAAQAALSAVKERQAALKVRLEAERLAAAQREADLATLHETERSIREAEEKAAALRRRLDR